MVKLGNQPGLKKNGGQPRWTSRGKGVASTSMIGSMIDRILRIQVAGRREIHRRSCGHGCDQTLSTWRFFLGEISHRAKFFHQ